MSDGTYVQFQVPGHPYSVLRVEFAELMSADEIVNAAAVLADALAAAFPQADESPAPQQEQRTAPAQRPSGQPANEQDAYCPEHKAVQLVLSKDEYQPKDDDGRILRDKFYCPGAKNGTGKNHNVWRSQAVFPQEPRNPVNLLPRSDEPVYSDDEWQGR